MLKLMNKSLIPPAEVTHTDVNIQDLFSEIIEEKNKNLQNYEKILEEALSQIASQFEEVKNFDFVRANKKEFRKKIFEKENEINNLWHRAQKGENVIEEFREQVEGLKAIYSIIFLKRRFTVMLDPVIRTVALYMQKALQDYIVISDTELLQVECQKRMKAESLGIDTETSGLDPLLHKICLIQIATKDHPVMIIDMRELQRQELNPLQALLTGPALKIFQNAKFDLKMLHQAGLEVAGSLFDTMIASYLLAGGRRIAGEGFSLKAIAKKYLNMDLSKEQQVSNWEGELTVEQLQYACNDAKILLKLRDILRKKLAENNLAETARLEFDCIYSVADMELNGFFLDKEAVNSQKESLIAEIEQAEQEARADLGDINLRSPKQLLPLLQKKTGKKLESTDKEYLKAIGHPLFTKLIDYKEKYKFFKDNFVDIPEKTHRKTGRIHADYNQIGTETGRFTCQKPNLQQVPRKKEIRSCFKPEPGHKFIIADYSQIELRIGAEISKDPVMIEAYSQGKDLHTLTASFITGKQIEEVTKNDRQLAKAVNFGLIYGAGAETFRKVAKSDYGIEITSKEAVNFRNKFFELYKGIKRWHELTQSRQEYITYTIGGRFRKFSRLEEYKLTDRLNSPDQGTGADILKKAMVLLRPRIARKAKIVHIVHDEIILEAPAEKAEEVKKILEDAMKEAGQYYIKSVPVEVEGNICNSWAEK